MLRKSAWSQVVQEVKVMVVRVVKLIVGIMAKANVDI